MSDHVTGWHNLPLGQLFTKLVNGGTPSTAISTYWNGKTPWVTGADFTSNGIGEIRRHVSEIGISSSSTSVVEPGNILLVTRTGVGKLAIAKQAIAISQDITGVYIDKKQLGVEFAYYLLAAELENLKKLNQGTSINGIIRADLERHKVSIPIGIGHQQKIARILQTVDRAIEQTEALIDKYQQIKAGLMHDLFTRGIGPDGHLRPPHDQAPQLYQQTPIGWIPKEWHYELLDNLAIRGSGHTPSKSHPEYWNGGIKWLSLADSPKLDRLYISKTAFEISSKGIQNSSAVLHPPGIVALSRDAGIGKSAITTAPMAVSQHFMCWKCGDLMDNHFLYYWLQNNKRVFENIAMGSTILTIGLSYFKRLRIACPTELLEQIAISDKLRSMDNYIFSLRQDLEKIKKQKSGLMRDLLTGMVPVKVDAESPEPNHV